MFFFVVFSSHQLGDFHCSDIEVELLVGSKARSSRIESKLTTFQKRKKCSDNHILEAKEFQKNVERKCLGVETPS